MTIIAPSILSADFSNLKSELEILEDIHNLWLHLDIMDGHFVPNLTFGLPVIKSIKHSTTNKLDAHFMVNNPEFYIEHLKDVGLYNFTFHLETVKNHLEFIKNAKQHYPSVGISIKPDTPIHYLTDEILNEINLVLIMTVNPGFSGQSFMPNAADKVNELNERRANLDNYFLIQVDGGVTDRNAAQLINDGADNLVSGSFIFNCDNKDYPNQIEKLREN
jgi:ribulose-phosphate 3-epimerase